MSRRFLSLFLHIDDAYFNILSHLCRRPPHVRVHPHIIVSTRAHTHTHRFTCNTTPISKRSTPHPGTLTCCRSFHWSAGYSIAADVNQQNTHKERTYIYFPRLRLDEPGPPGTEVPRGGVAEGLLERLERPELLLDGLLHGARGLAAPVGAEGLPVEGVVPHLPDFEEGNERGVLEAEGRVVLFRT